MKIIWRLIVPGSFWERTCNTLICIWCLWFRIWWKLCWSWYLYLQWPNMLESLTTWTKLQYKGSLHCTHSNDCPYRTKRIGLCLVLLIFCLTKSDCQHRFTNHPVWLFFSDMQSRDSISTSDLSETHSPYTGSLT